MEFDKEIEQFYQKAMTGLQLRIRESQMTVGSWFDKIQSFADEEEISYTMSEKIVVDALSDNHVIAPFLRIGFLVMQEQDEKNAMKFPLMLPLKGINGFMFDFGIQNKIVPKIFQNIMLRLYLSMRPDLLKISVVDMDYGNDFPLLKGIDNKHIKTRVCDETTEIDDLVKGLVDEVRAVGNKLSVKYSNVDEYNERNVVDPIPYHLVFIDDFPQGFSQQAFDNLFRLIHNGNARKAGILVFINYCGLGKMNVFSQNSFNIDMYRSDCGNIVMSDDGNLRLFGLSDVDIEGLSFRCDTVDGAVMESFQSLLKSFIPPERIYSLDDWAQSLISGNRMGYGSTIDDGVKVPAGFVNSSDYFYFSIANPNDINCNDHFSLVAGDPGYGKTTLVKNIVINAALKYSPDELNLYLVDFAKGTSFKTFRGMPHVKALMLANSKEYAVRILDYIEKIIKDRAALFASAQAQQTEIEVDDFVTYRRVTGEKIPYILLVIDEFHVLFTANDEFTTQAKIRLCSAIKEWRKYGFGTILCTQSINGVSFGDAEQHISYRFALKMVAENSRAVLRNFSATKLTQKGQVIMNNTASGDESCNVMFRSADKERYIEYVQLMLKRYGKPEKQYVCEVGKRTDMASNLSLKRMLTDGTTANVNDCDIYVGCPDLLRDEHSRLRLSRIPNSNILVLGDDVVSLIQIQAALIMQIEAQSPEGSKIYIVDAFNGNDEQFGLFDHLPEINGLVTLVHSPQIDLAVNEVWDEMQKRKQLQQNSGFAEPRIVISIINAQNCYPLRPTGSGFSAELPKVSKKLVEIIQDGSSLGIHVMMHSMYEGSLFGRDSFFASDLKLKFSNVILMTNSGVDRTDYGYRPNVDQKGRVLLLNNRIDNERYELCRVYNRCSFTPYSGLGRYLIAELYTEE